MVARIAVVGCGWWSSFAHLPALTRNPAAEIVAVADPDPEKGAAAARAFDVPLVFEDVEQLLDEVEVDGVVVAVPHIHHFRCARVALERGAHVLLEKPMVIEVDDARELVLLARRLQLHLLIGYPWHYNAQALALRDAIADGRLGELEHVSCVFASTARELYRGTPEDYEDVLGYTLDVPAPGAGTYSDPAISGGGQGQTQVTHAVALLQLLTGLEPESVAGFTESFELNVDLADSAAIRFRSGALGSLNSVGSVVAGHDEVLEYRLFGHDGHVHFDVNNGVASIHTRGREELRPLELDLRYPHWAPSDNLVELACGRGTNGSPPELGFAAVAFVDALYRSARSGGSAVAVERI